MLTLRQFSFDDGNACLDLFRDTVRRVNSRDYSEIQVGAWASAEINGPSWIARFAQRHAYVALLGKSIVGFADMTSGGYLDRIFVSAGHQRQGIATALATQLLHDASELNLERVYADVSITAVPFFVRMGFSGAVLQEVECRGVLFNNYRMTLGGRQLGIYPSEVKAK